MTERREPEAFLSPLSVGRCSPSIIAALLNVGYIVFVHYADGDHIVMCSKTVEIVCHVSDAVVKV